jgi:hypothetical protein
MDDNLEEKILGIDIDLTNHYFDLFKKNTSTTRVKNQNHDKRPWRI